MTTSTVVVAVFADRTDGSMFALVKRGPAVLYTTDTYEHGSAYARVIADAESYVGREYPDAHVHTLDVVWS